MGKHAAPAGRVVFMNVPLRGHWEPSLPLVASLVASGREVFYFGYDCMRADLERAGARFVPYAAQGFDFGPAALASFGSIFSLLMDFTEANLDPTMALLRGLDPALLAHDQFCPWAKYAAKVLGIRAAGLVTTLIFERGSAGAGAGASALSGLAGIEEANRKRVELSARHGLPAWGIVDALQNKEALNLVFRMEALQRGSYAAYDYVGPCLPERRAFSLARDELPPLPAGAPLAYLSMGTVYKAGEGTLARAVASLRASGFCVVVAAGGALGELGGFAADPLVIARARLDQVAVLRRADVFLSHGGMNGTQEGLAAGVPPIFHPLQIEQKTIAETVVAHGAGLLWDGIEDLGRLARAACGDAALKRAVLRLGAGLEKPGGVASALALLEAQLLESSS